MLVSRFWLQWNSKKLLLLACFLSLCPCPPTWIRARTNQHYTAHLLQGKKQLESYPPSWSHLSPHNLSCCTRYLPPLPLCHCILPISFLIILSLVSLSTLYHTSHPGQPLSFSTSPIHGLSLCTPLFLHSVHFPLFVSAGRHISAQEGLTPLLWYSKHSQDISSWNMRSGVCHLCLLIHCVSWVTLVFLLWLIPRSKGQLSKNVE